MTTQPDPLLSVVVIMVDGVRAVEQCLEALAEQAGAPRLEVIVPYDDTVSSVLSLRGRFPKTRFLPLGDIPTRRSLRNAAGQHELIDQRRTRGLQAASGDIVALLEDRGVPRPGWARAAVDAHRSAAAAIGGAIENGVDKPLNWAVYLIDFFRYQLPFNEGEAEFISDVNITYKARALRAVEPSWSAGYVETTVNWALARAGESLWLTPTMVVEERRSDLTLAALCAERFHWGRLFATSRVAEAPPLVRLVLVLSSPLLPALLLYRIARKQIGNRRSLARFLRLGPMLVVLLMAKMLGELVGYLSGKG